MPTLTAYKCPPPSTTQQEISIEYEFETKKPEPKPEPKKPTVVNNYNIENNNYGKQINVIGLLGARKLVQSDDRSSHHEMTPARTISNESANGNTRLSSRNGMVDRRRLVPFSTKDSFSVTYKTETTDTTAQTFTTKTMDWTTSTITVNCQCPAGENDRYEIPRVDQLVEVSPHFHTEQPLLTPDTACLRARTSHFVWSTPRLATLHIPCSHLPTAPDIACLRARTRRKCHGPPRCGPVSVVDLLGVDLPVSVLNALI